MSNNIKPINPAITLTRADELTRKYTACDCFQDLAEMAITSDYGTSGDRVDNVRDKVLLADAFDWFMWCRECPIRAFRG